MTITFLQGDACEMLATLPPASVQTIVTSPPYWMLRRYTDDPREIGRESTPAAYIAALTAVFSACYRVLRDDGTLWIVIGDTYARNPKKGVKFQRGAATYMANRQADEGNRGGEIPPGLKEKSLIGLPWRLAFALQDLGWILRAEIIWEKRNGMPENVQDRPTRSHEQVFLFAKSRRYFFDAAVVREPSSPSSQARVHLNGGAPPPKGIAGVASGVYKAPILRAKAYGQGRNIRSVWSIANTGIADEHYAPMPEALAQRCILAGSRAGDTVLDPFVGSGTVARVCARVQRACIGIDLAYQELQEKRTDKVQVEMQL